MADPLSRYHGKRNFDSTTEPKGRRRRSGGDPHFVIQHHLASSDHFDFRLEIDGVLVSWAVPKGPSLDPREHRLAVRTEDHPLDYETYEGTIAAGEYGGGTVQVWDRGTFRNLSHDEDVELSAADGLERGHLSFWLDGAKLRGGYTLIRTRGYGKQDSWLLTKKKDEGADARRKPVKTQTESVLTGRTLAEIAADG